MSTSMPVRASYRQIESILKVSFKNCTEHRQEEYDKVCSVFKKAGGSWESLFQGDPDSLVLLKKVIKLAIKNGTLTKVKPPK